MANPLSEIINDKQYEILSKLNIISKIPERNYIIRKKYNELKPKLGTEEAIYNLMEDYNLTFETLRKIIYTKKYRFLSD